MIRIDRRDLDCLLVELRNGQEIRPVAPHSNVWGRNCEEGLEVLIQAAGPRAWLRETLVKAHLLYPKSTPAWAEPWLLRNAPDVMGVGLANLEQGQWGSFAVPVADERAGYVWELIVGVGSGLPLVAPSSEKSFSPDSLRSLEMVNQLVRDKWGKSCCFCLSSPGVSAPVISGLSLGLPSFLAAAACVEGLPDLRILATGQLDESGAVLPVTYLQKKVDSAKGSFDLFIYPQGSGAPVSDFECVPVTHVAEALVVMSCYRPGVGLKIVQAEKALRSGQGLAREICSFQTGMFLWLQRNRDAIANGLVSDPSLGELVRQLQCWCDSTLQNDPVLGGAVLKCLPLEFVEKVSEVDPELAWTIAVLQMDSSNHRGLIVEFGRWKTLADRLRPKIADVQQAGQHMAMYYVQAIIGDRHNRYVFSIDVPGDDEALFELKEMEDAFGRQRARGTCREDGRLGRYYGTLGQNYGFCGPDYLGETLGCLDQAVSFFCADSKRSEKERDRDLLYKVFALSSAGRTNDAFEILRGIALLWDHEGWNLNGMDPYQIHGLLRVHADSGAGMDAHLWHGLEGVWKRQAMRPHPWQLISYNLGLLAPDRATALCMLKQSLALCLSPENGPTIKVMALLPLAQIHALGFRLPDLEELSRQALAPVHGKELSEDHFAELLQAESIEELLQMVQKEKKRLFPFSYR